MTTINPVSGGAYTTTISSTEGSGIPISLDIPSSQNSTIINISATLSLPTLPAPKIGGMSLESLLQAVNMEGRATATKAGLESLQARAAERQRVNAEKLEEIQKNLERIESKKTVNKVLNVFKKIGAVLGAVAAAATLAIGVVTGNPLMIVAGATLTVMAVNSIVSMASDGKYSISAGISAIAKECGASDETAQWIGFGVEMAITLVGACLSFGAGLSSAASKAAELVPTIIKILSMTQKVTTVASGLNSVGQGAAQIVSAVYDYKIANSQADQKELAAILERIQQAIGMEQDFLEAVMERSSELMGKVGEIVQENAQAQIAILTGTSPAMA